jgi:transcription-repair coupling factor
MSLEPILSALAPALPASLAEAPLALRRAARLPVLAAIYLANPQPIFFLTDRADHALTLLDELNLWLPDVPKRYFPEPNPLFYENAPWGESTRRERLAVLTLLAAYHIPGAQLTEHVSRITPPIIIAPLRAVLSRTIPRREFLKAIKTLKVGQVVQPDELARQWVAFGYEATHIVTTTGQFSRRGGILDVWPPAEPHPVRIEFFGDEVDTMRHFDPATQRTTSTLERMLISPAREYLANENVAWSVFRQPEENERNTQHIPLTEYHLPLLHPTPASALEYLPRTGLLILDDRQALADIAAEIEDQAVQTRTDLIADGSLPADFPIPYIPWSELEDTFPASRTLELGGPIFDDNVETSERSNVETSQRSNVPTFQRSNVQTLFTPGPRFAGRLRNALEHLVEVTGRGETVYIVSRQFSRLQELWQEQSAVKNQQSPIFIEGSLTEGFTFTPSPSLVEPVETPLVEPVETRPIEPNPPGLDKLDQRFPLVEPVETRPIEPNPPGLDKLDQRFPLVEPVETRPIEPNPRGLDKLDQRFALVEPVETKPVETRPIQIRPIHILTDGELFGWRRPEARRKAQLTAEAPEAAYGDLQTGDWVVHVDHGVGKFAGLVRRSVEGIEREYLAVEYADEAQLYVPVYQADRLTRYVGPDSREPHASRLGSTEWKNDKTKAKEAAEAVARELLDLYATRQVVKGYSFGPDTPWQQELEASFPYVETPDQLRVLIDLKRDMESARPMDRLLCGDVGYGKTEVALRAAFKAVMDGKQVAVLVPTTVLAQQHYHTFRDRLAAFPATVEMLSRFRSPQQQREILLKLSQGAVDIVIGTHRLISGDVLFKDLGLLIIDEEQRFGVTHKEQLKRLRTEVDVLTLTATPIPRTLYMALTGVRDISTLNTPPEERLPIATHVGPYNPKIVKQAIQREMERGGQIYFVHNRVHSIEGIAAHLRKLVPEARITIGHGQLDENTLADRMDAFSAGEYDILLCTTIIESGLDIPNCNTLIVDRADTFGLAQLYQLRGRVGRGAQRAYAYFFRHNKITPTHEGRQRLETIAENTQLGAGFSIAMRDLEIRGAGEILGTRQSGYIADVGFHLYTRLLADAVRRLRNTQHATHIDETRSDLRLAYDYHLAIPVNVDLPLPIGIPATYIPEQETRLRLYRRMADMRSLPEVDALADEFADRFGTPPEETRNLLYQVRLKLLAEKAGLAGITSESGQIVMRYPPLPEGVTERTFTTMPDLSDLGVRRGKNALWMPIITSDETGWQSRLAQVLERVAG